MRKITFYGHISLNPKKWVGKTSLLAIILWKSVWATAHPVSKGLLMIKPLHILRKISQWYIILVQIDEIFLKVKIETSEEKFKPEID